MKHVVYFFMTRDRIFGNLALGSHKPFLTQYHGTGSSDRLAERSHLEFNIWNMARIQLR